MTTTRSRVAIVSAMREELHALHQDLQGTRIERVEHVAGRDFHLGTLHGHDAVLVLAGIGKVAAATTAALLLDRFEVDALLFTGVAGGLGAGVHVGDVVIGDALLQHDLDASPIFPRWEVPLTGKARFAADTHWSDALARAAVATLGKGHAVHRGLIVSGDRFVSTAAESAALRALLPDALAVEMEGAAVAQVCHDFGKPFAVMRTVSDRADDSAHIDFPRFVAEVASTLARAIVREALQDR
jgi:adenosylhomocysteine nucleosidase